MDQDVIEQVLKEILQQQKELALQMRKGSDARQELFVRLESLAETWRLSTA